jgi:hypothetical protein
MTSKSTTAKVAVGYLPAAARCKNCSHAYEEIADRMPPYDTRTWRCKKGGFAISPLAICNYHQRESSAAIAAKQAGAR